MLFSLPFNFPFYNNYRPRYYKDFNQRNKSYNVPNSQQKIYNQDSKLFGDITQFQNNQYQKDSEPTLESSESFFEIFGLKLYFDDILIICILFFLYNEKVHDDELFICLILLLFS